jgi:hypothetical protein
MREKKECEMGKNEREKKKNDTVLVVCACTAMLRPTDVNIL